MWASAAGRRRERSAQLRAFALALFSALALACVAAEPACAQRGGRGFMPRPRPQPILPYRPIPPIFSPYRFQMWRVPLFTFVPRFEYEYRWSPPCGLFSQWGYGCGVVPIYLPLYTYGVDNNQRAQIALTDGTIYSVTDYWVVDDQLHFRTMEDGGTKSVEHVVGMDQLDQQKTIDLDNVRGFRFVLRNEPMEEYLKDHPVGGPSAPVPPQR